jgi:hypothetical protein
VRKYDCYDGLGVYEVASGAARFAFLAVQTLTLHPFPEIPRTRWS